MENNRAYDIMPNVTNEKNKELNMLTHIESVIFVKS